MNRVLCGAAILSLGLVAASANAATIINGSFELGTDPGAGFTTETVGSTAITGWDVGGFGVDYIGGYWQASDGVRSVDLSGTNSGSVSQTLETVIGTTYTVTFDLSGNPDAGVGNKIAVVSISGSLPDVKLYEVTAGNSRDNMNWQTYSYSFTAFATSSTLTFASAEYNPFGPALDNVSILDDGGGTGSTIPEPATWAMLMVGFGLVGVSVRKRGLTRVTA
jgi:choice-of-anchor C domain-containing protein